MICKELFNSKGLRDNQYITSLLEINYRSSEANALIFLGNIEEMFSGYR